MTITGLQCYLWDVTFSFFQLMIVKFEVYHRESNGTLKLVKKVINCQKCTLILYCDLVQLAVIDTHTKGTSFILMNRIRAPQGTTLGWMKLLSRISLNCYFNYFNSVGANPYGRIEDRLSIWKNVFSKVYISIMRDSGKII